MAPKFSEHVLFFTVNDSAPPGLTDDLAEATKKYESTERVLALNVGNSEPVKLPLQADVDGKLGNSSFVLHIRAETEAAVDRIIAQFHADPMVGPNITNHLGESLLVRFESQPIGSPEPKFPVWRFGLLKYKGGVATAEEIQEIKELFGRLPEKFSLIKQVNVGENGSKAELVKEEEFIKADVGFDLGLVLGFESVEDLKELTSKSNTSYMEYMTATLSKFEVVIVNNLILI